MAGNTSLSSICRTVLRFAMAAVLVYAGFIAMVGLSK